MAEKRLRTTDQKGGNQIESLGQNNDPCLQVFLPNRSETNNADLDLVDEKLKRIIIASRSLSLFKQNSFNNYTENN